MWGFDEPELEVVEAALPEHWREFVKFSNMKNKLTVSTERYSIKVH